ASASCCEKRGPSADRGWRRKAKECERVLEWIRPPLGLEFVDDGDCVLAGLLDRPPHLIQRGGCLADGRVLEHPNEGPVAGVAQRRQLSGPRRNRERGAGCTGGPLVGAPYGIAHVIRVALPVKVQVDLCDGRRIVRSL